jgi:protein phosphatase
MRTTAAIGHTAGARGPRLINADAVAAYRRPGASGTAFALADGVGDDPTAARAAQLAAAAAVRADTDDPAEAILAAQAAVRADAAASDCVLVVALPSGDGYRIGWVGDARGYASIGNEIRQVTTDQTLANHFRARGITPNPRMEHVVVVSVRTTTPSEIGTATVPTPEFLVLASDGVHGRVSDDVMVQALRYAPDPAQALVEAATLAGTTDNATALVVQCLPAKTGETTIAMAA